MDAHQRGVEQVRRWYHDMARDATAINEAALSSLSPSYRVQLVALNFELPETSLRTFRPLSLAYALINVQLLTKTRRLGK